MPGVHLLTKKGRLSGKAAFLDICFYREAALRGYWSSSIRRSTVPFDSIRRFKLAGRDGIAGRLNASPLANIGQFFDLAQVEARPRSH